MRKGDEGEVETKFRTGRGGGISMLQLTPDEQTWLEAYRQTLREHFPQQIEDIIIFGSKARGDAGPDSDVDVLIVLREGDRQTKQEVRRLGHHLAVLSDAVPSIMVYTKAEWTEREQDGSPFYR